MPQNLLSEFFSSSKIWTYLYFPKQEELNLFIESYRRSQTQIQNRKLRLVLQKLGLDFFPLISSQSTSIGLFRIQGLEPVNQTEN